MSTESSELSGEEGFFPPTAAKTRRSGAHQYSFQVSFDDSQSLKKQEWQYTLLLRS